MTSLSVLVPVFNEEHLVATSLERLEVLESSRLLSRIQVIVVDDCSTDSTAEVVGRFASERGTKKGNIEWVFLRHERNAGKGAAVRTALARADAEITVIHDADLEYHPRDLHRIVKVFVEEDADAVFGSRFAGGEARRLLFYRHELGNRLLTFLTNVATNLNLTDMETCYKAVRTSLLKSIPLVSNDFRLEPELTIKLAKRQARIFEVPISYSGRTYQEGKKIDWRDGLRALAAITRFTLSDRIYAGDGNASRILGLSRAPHFNAWMADTIRPFVGDHVLEIGSGTGTVTRRLIPRRRYVASDINPLYLSTLETLRGDKPYLSAEYCDITDVASFPKVDGNFDTVVCLNVIEHVDQDVEALRNIRSVLAPHGRAIVLVPRGETLFGTLDETLGHRRRYTESSLRAAATAAGFDVKQVLEFNRIGTPAWWLNGKVLRRQDFGAFEVAIWNLLTPVFRSVDRALPLPALSLIAILEPMSEAPTPIGKRSHSAAA